MFQHERSFMWTHLRRESVRVTSTQIETAEIPVAWQRSPVVAHEIWRFGCHHISRQRTYTDNISIIAYTDFYRLSNEAYVVPTSVGVRS